MAKNTADRDLTTLEYVVLGFISVEAQSGYSIISTLEAGVHRWSASPGAIYPILKRLEQIGLIDGVLEMPNEARARKMYRLSDEGSTRLDEWLLAPLNNRELLEERDITLLKFLFLEKRLSHAQIMAWLEAYRAGTAHYKVARQQILDYAVPQVSAHQRLIWESTLMDLEMQERWIEQAITQLSGES
jgi:DNA-binding PadR family transcriptional regulator